ncbi:MAG: ATP-binding protein [Halofilum sp. (in: g-proteobacteria)]
MEAPIPSQPPIAPAGRLATGGLLAAYFAVATWGAELLGAANAPAPLIWPAAGIGLALVLTRGLRVWPLIFLVSVPAGMLSTYDGGVTLAQVGGALINGVAATVEPVLAAWLIWRMTGEDYLARAGPFLVAMLVAAPVACFVGAVPLVLGQWVGGLVTTHSWIGWSATWHAAALSDWMGLLALAPPFVLWLARMQLDLGLREAGELAALAGVTTLVLLMPAPEQARYLLVAAHLAIAMRVPVKWAATAVGLTSVVYLSLSTLELRMANPQDFHVYFLRDVVFAFTLNVATYVTALLRAESDERRTRAEDLARELSSAEHRERQRIAQVLHDHLQQLLVAANMAVARLRGGEVAAGERADALIREAIGNARTLSVELHPPVLDTLGLAAAMRWLGEEARDRHGLDVQVETDESSDAELPEIASFVLQATRELLLNVVKHADSDTAWLRLRRTSSWLEVEVEDRGAGVHPDQLTQTNSGHYGLANIRQRVELLGGRFDVASNGGCRIRLRLPLRRTGRRGKGWRRRRARTRRLGTRRDA